MVGKREAAPNAPPPSQASQSEQQRQKKHQQLLQRQWEQQQHRQQQHRQQQQRHHLPQRQHPPLPQHPPQQQHQPPPQQLQQQPHPQQQHQDLLAFQPFSFLIEVSFWRLLSERKLKEWRLNTPWVPLIATYSCTAAKPLQQQQHNLQHVQQGGHHAAGPCRVRIDAEALDIVHHLLREQQQEQVEQQFEQQQHHQQPLGQEQEEEQQLLLLQEWLDGGDGSSPLPSPEAAEAEAAAAAAAGAAAGAPPPPGAAAAGTSRRSALMSLPPFAARCLKSGTRPLVGLLRVYNNMEDLVAAVRSRAAAQRCLLRLEESICCCSRCSRNRQQHEHQQQNQQEAQHELQQELDLEQQQQVMHLPVNDPALWTLRLCCRDQQQQQQQQDTDSCTAPSSPFAWAVEGFASPGTAAAAGAADADGDSTEVAAEAAGAAAGAVSGSTEEGEVCACRVVYGQLPATAWPCRFVLESFIDLKRQRAVYSICTPALRPAADIRQLQQPVRAAPPVTLRELVADLESNMRDDRSQQQQQQHLQREAFTAAELSAISRRIRSLDSNTSPFLAGGCFLLLKDSSSNRNSSSNGNSKGAGGKMKSNTGISGCCSAGVASESLQLLPLEQLEKLRHLLPASQQEHQREQQHEEQELYLCVMDPSSNPGALGWPLRCLLPALSEGFELFGRRLNVLSFRDWLLDLRVESAAAAAAAAEATAATAAHEAAEAAANAAAHSSPENAVAAPQAAANAAAAARRAAATAAAAAAAWGQVVEPLSRIFVVRLPTAAELLGAFTPAPAAVPTEAPAAAAAPAPATPTPATPPESGAAALPPRKASMVLGRLKRVVPGGVPGHSSKIEHLFHVDLGRFLDPRVESAAVLRPRVSAVTAGFGNWRGHLRLRSSEAAGLLGCQGGLGRLKAEAARDGILAVRPSMECNAVVLDVPMPGHPRFLLGDLLEKGTATLERLIDSHNVVLLLTDSRESRWLPSLIVAERQNRYAAGLLRGSLGPPLAVTVALGFDSMLVMRHGFGGNKLGCYFCHAVNGPADSISHRTLDEQCTVTRPGVGALACSVAVELLAALTQHPQGFAAPHTETDPLAGGSAAAAAGLQRQKQGGFSCLGATPHMIRANFADFSLMKEHQPQCPTCSCCSPGIVSAYRSQGLSFLREATSCASRLEEYSGLAAFKKGLQQRALEVINLSDSE
ncbi:thiF family domain-containing protein, putative [Eimeria necatrix]|uniref:ThiF family domain-containing protein, putative n=1 Tax=Eimeria necatrix TaxID=51315 RepID=U6N1F7_9EIME|nr:thiF family domain-containing protein, putative [Eimeria necatrix]CDJ70328.1 thiF family domain-containing protein, putative [Eimeria necatrix]